LYTIGPCVMANASLSHDSFMCVCIYVGVCACVCDKTRSCVLRLVHVCNESYIYVLHSYMCDTTHAYRHNGHQSRDSMCVCAMTLACVCVP